MSLLKQTRAITAVNLSNIPKRLGTSIVTAIGTAAVVAVLLSILAMAAGFRDVANTGGRPDRVVVIRSGSGTESASRLARDSVTTIMGAPGIRKTPQGEPILSADALMIIDLTLKGSGSGANVALRGVGPMNQFLRPEIKIVAGRMFKRGLHEIVVGKSAQSQFAGLELGGRVRLRNTDWRVVGVFTTGDAHESELMADSDTVLSAYDRTLVQGVTVLLDTPADFDRFKDYLTHNPTLSVEVQRESDYLAAQSSSEISVIRVVAFLVGGVMGLGAVFGALNTMYSAVSVRAVEIATLRAIGFGAVPIVVSVLAEALVLSLIGAGVGTVLAWLLFNGKGVSALNLGSFTQMVFHVTITPGLVAEGVIWACAIGLLGGLFPAIRAARQPIATALRTVA